MVFGNTQKYEGSINTAIAKVFDMTVAAAGVPVKQLKPANIEHYVSTTFSGSHAEYYPGAEKMTIQLAFTPGNGKLLSAQVVGYSGVDKRIDLLASVIKRGGTIDELTEIEHAYAPPFSSAKDPVNIAGFAAENLLTGKIKFFYWDETSSIDRKDFLVDVRTPKEFAEGSIPGAINIPLDELRCRFIELPKNRMIHIYCQIGLRGYLASRILLQNGFEKVYNLSGGYRLWEACTKETEEVSIRENVLIA
jgi:rhodanese-related sulfurtransferase